MAQAIIPLLTTVGAAAAPHVVEAAGSAIQSIIDHVKANAEKKQPSKTAAKRILKRAQLYTKRSVPVQRPVARPKVQNVPATRSALRARKLARNMRSIVRNAVNEEINGVGPAQYYDTAEIQEHAMPAAQGFTAKSSFDVQSGQGPFRKQFNESATVEGVEYIGGLDTTGWTVDPTKGEKVFELFLHPNMLRGTRLAYKSKEYTHYNFEYIEFIYEPVVSVQTPGAVMSALCEDVGLNFADSGDIGLRRALELPNSMMFPVYQSQSMTYRFKVPVQALLTRNGSSDMNLIYQGRFFCKAASTLEKKVYGNLMMKYKIHFYGNYLAKDTNLGPIEAPGSFRRVNEPPAGTRFQTGDVWYSFDVPNVVEPQPDGISIWLIQLTAPLGQISAGTTLWAYKYPNGSPAAYAGNIFGPLYTSYQDFVSDINRLKSAAELELLQTPRVCYFGGSGIANQPIQVSNKLTLGQGQGIDVNASDRSTVDAQLSEVARKVADLQCQDDEYEECEEIPIEDCYDAAKPKLRSVGSAKIITVQQQATSTTKQTEPDPAFLRGSAKSVRFASP